jgi:hypothetical protein
LGKTSSGTQDGDPCHHQNSGGSFNPATVLNPAFKALDALISDYGVDFYLVFVWLSLVVIVWILSGGLRRKWSQGNSASVIPGIIITMRSPNQSPPPIIIANVDPMQNHDNENPPGKTSSP